MSLDECGEGIQLALETVKLHRNAGRLISHLLEVELQGLHGQEHRKVSTTAWTDNSLRGHRHMA
jgi:hypothetical protein